MRKYGKTQDDLPKEVLGVKIAETEEWERHQRLAVHFECRRNEKCLSQI